MHNMKAPNIYVQYMYTANITNACEMYATTNEM